MEVHGTRKVSERLPGQTCLHSLDAGREQVLVAVGELVAGGGVHRRLRQRDAVVAVGALHELLLDGGGQLDALLVRLHLVALRHLQELEAAEVLLPLRLHPLLEEELADGLLVYHVLVAHICE